MIKFTEKNHTYRSIDAENPIDWIGITTLISHFKPKFDAMAGSVKSSKNPRSKWYKMDPLAIREAWNSESARSLHAGKWYHNKVETSILSTEEYMENQVTYKVVKPLIIGEEKYAPSQRLEEGCVYPEHFVFLESYGICGQSDKVTVFNQKVNIDDHKTSKTIAKEGFKSWEGISERMNDPISHLDNCNMVHYTLQASLYMYMILKHNPLLTPGRLTLNHVVFEVLAEDDFGYPIYKQDNNGGFVIKDIIPYTVPYMKMEVISILRYLKENRQEIFSKPSIHVD